MSEPGNKNGTAIKCPQERKRAYESFCEHISNGYPVKAWSYRNGEHKCCYDTIMRYITEDYAPEFEAFLKQEAHAKSYLKWFKRGEALTDGKIKGNPSPQTWATVMRNMFGWDKQTAEEKSQQATADLERMKAFFDLREAKTDSSANH